MEIKKLIEKNDEELKKREDILIRKVDAAYEEAIKQAKKEFLYLTKVNPDIKPSHEQVKKIIMRMIASFRGEFGKLVKPFQEELVRQYEDALTEAASILAVRDEEKS